MAASRQNKPPNLAHMIMDILLDTIRYHSSYQHIL
jgi:hypothetical protein